MYPAYDEEYYTYADYCTWDDDERWELIDGVAYAMSPAPTVNHQSISAKLVTQLSNFLKGRTCRVFAAPFDVRLNADADDETVVQPDVLVVCDKSKFAADGRGLIGAPDLAIEILSQSTEKHDKHIKFKTYQRAGVREYWIIDPQHRIVMANLLTDGVYIARMYFEEDTVPVQVLEGCLIDLADVFEDLM